MCGVVGMHALLREYYLGIVVFGWLALCVSIWLWWLRMWSGVFDLSDLNLYRVGYGYGIEFIVLSNHYVRSLGWCFLRQVLRSHPLARDCKTLRSLFCNHAPSCPNMIPTKILSKCLPSRRTRYHTLFSLARLDA